MHSLQFYETDSSRGFVRGAKWGLQPTGGPSARGSLTQGDVPNVERIARSLFTDFLWPFEITSALLVIAVVGSIVLARRGGPGTSLDDEEEARPAARHVGAGSDEGPAAVLEPES